MTSSQWLQDYLKRLEEAKTLEEAIRLLPTSHYLGFIDENDPEPWCVVTSGVVTMDGSFVEPSHHVADGRTWREAIESAIRLAYEKVYLYDPHPSMGGALVPLPEEVKKLGDELGGKTMTLGKAISRIENTDWVKTTGQSAVYARENMITLAAEVNGQIHHWRVLRYRGTYEEAT